MNSISSLSEIAALFFKLGCIAFGGPAAHIAMMEDEVVTKRKWMGRQHFLDLVGATNLIPGPNSTEMAIHCGYHRGRIRGLLVAGACFIFPAVVITASLAYLYVQFGSLPQVEPFLYGIKPAVLAIILGAIYKLGRQALKGWKLGLIGVGVLAVSLWGVSEITAILAGGLFGMIWIYASGKISRGDSALSVIPGAAGSAWQYFKSLLPSSFFTAATGMASGVSGLSIFWIFMKVGSVLFGSGYVLVAYLDGELVNRLGWLTRSQLLDAIAIGQFTPGPVLSTATFIGYQISGFWGAAWATLGIFLPSFVFVLILNPIVPKLRESAWASAFLDAVNISAVGIMLSVTITLDYNVLLDWQSWFIALLSTSVYLGFKKINAVWIVLGGALFGFLLQHLLN